MTISHPTTEATPPASPGNHHEVRVHPTVDSERSSFIATVRQHLRRAKAVRELKRLIRSAPTATVRNDLMTIAARHERYS